MNIKPIRKRFIILLYINIVKVINPLSKSARITFDYDWDNYYSLEFGWLLWEFKIDF